MLDRVWGELREFAYARQVLLEGVCRCLVLVFCLSFGVLRSAAVGEKLLVEWVPVCHSDKPHLIMELAIAIATSLILSGLSRLTYSSGSCGLSPGLCLIFRLARDLSPLKKPRYRAFVRAWCWKRRFIWISLSGDLVYERENPAFGEHLEVFWGTVVTVFLEEFFYPFRPRCWICRQLIPFGDFGTDLGHHVGQRLFGEFAGLLSISSGLLLAVIGLTYCRIFGVSGSTGLPG